MCKRASVEVEFVEIEDTEEYKEVPRTSFSVRRQVTFEFPLGLPQWSLFKFRLNKFNLKINIKIWDNFGFKLKNNERLSPVELPNLNWWAKKRLRMKSRNAWSQKASTWATTGCVLIRFLILQGEVESISQMVPKSGSEENPGLLEYLEVEF